LELKVLRLIESVKIDSHFEQQDWPS